MAVILIAMGIWHENEATVEDGQFSVDIKLLGIPEKVSPGSHVPGAHTCTAWLARISGRTSLCMGYGRPPGQSRHFSPDDTWVIARTELFH